MLLPGTTPDVPAYTVKVHAKFPNEDPAIRGVLCLHDLETGALLALMDSTYLTAVRTGLTGALAAHLLARTDAATVAVVGAGTQGTHQLRSLAMLRPLRWVSVYDVSSDRAKNFAGNMTRELGIPVEAAETARAALREATIVLVATWAREPFIRLEMLAAGTHVTTLGADEPGKAEVDAEVVSHAVFVCDNRQLAVEMGAVGNVGLGHESIDAELGEVLAGSHTGRASPEEITVYGGVGLAFQDAVAAWEIYEAARSQGIGEEVDFLA